MLDVIMMVMMVIMIGIITTGEQTQAALKKKSGAIEAFRACLPPLTQGFRDRLAGAACAAREGAICARRFQSRATCTP